MPKLASALLCLFVSIVIVSQCQTSNPAPPTPAPLDNTVVNITYFDLLLLFTNVEDFNGQNQTQWRFLRRLCGLTPIIRDYFGQYPSTRYPPAVGNLTQRCAISSRPGTPAMPSVSIVLSERGHPVLPFSSNQYLVTIMFQGTARALDNFTRTIRDVEADAMEVLGVAAISNPYALVDVYDQYGRVWLTNDPTASLSIAWYVILVSFFALMCLVVAAFYFRASSLIRFGKGNADREAEEEQEMFQDEGNDQKQMERWEEVDVSEEKDRMLEESRLAQQPELVLNDSITASVISGRRSQLDSTLRESAMGRSTTSYPGGGGGGGGGTISGTINGKPGRWSAAVFEEAMSIEPALNLPPESAVVRSAQMIAKLKAEAARKTRRLREGKGALPGEDPLGEPVLQMPGDLTELPPESSEDASRRTTKYVPPLGLAARRMAAMMTTLAVKQHSHHLKQGTVGLMRGSLLAPSRRQHKQFASLDPSGTESVFGSQLEASVEGRPSPSGGEGSTSPQRNINPSPDSDPLL
jgi:hypothetical protein